MQMVKKILFTLVLFWFAIILFMPKEQLYFGLEHVLEKQGVKINEEAIEENVFGLELQNISVYLRGIKVMTVKKVSVFTLLFYSRITIEGLETDKGVSSLMTLSFDKAVGIHSILDPLHIHFEADGKIGHLTGDVALNEKKIYIEFEKGKGNTIKRFLKKDQRGWYYGY